MFEFATAQRIVFGEGVVTQLPAVLRDAGGTRALLVTGAHPERFRSAFKDIPHLLFCVPSEPTVDLARDGVASFRAAGCDSVVAIGGGSVIDAGKAIAALAANSGEPLDYLEVVGRGAPLANAPFPFLAVPTTAGTGSEVTRNAVLASPEHGVKASLRSLKMLPAAALVDPALTYHLPPAVTASTGLDALTQLIEPYVGAKRNPFVDLYCRKGISLAARALPLAFRQPNNAEARRDMSFAALLGGLALANAGLGIVHGFAAPIGGAFDAPHGAVCAALLPHAMAVNIRALQQRDPTGVPLSRYQAAAILLTGDARATAEDGIRGIRQLCTELEIPPLSRYGITTGDVATLVEKAARASSTKGNPIALTPAEMTEILKAAL
ncbi:MAG: iron-containing alcohol dehydrogenase [Bryobacteraceae bacterium]|nr:iron-containing alcohol dehydrogenase [Bryobacteraceae bacterium]